MKNSITLLQLLLMALCFNVSQSQSAFRERLDGEIILTDAVGSKSDNAEAAIDMNFNTTTVTYRDTYGELWLKLYFEEVSCVQNIYVYWDGKANVILSCPADSTLCQCDTNKRICDEYQFSVIFERNMNPDDQTERNCTYGDTLKVESIDEAYFNLEAEEIAVIRYEVRDSVPTVPSSIKWIPFTAKNQAMVSTDFSSKDVEQFYVRLPCEESVWFKLFLNSDDGQNSHVEIKSKVEGNIYCNGAGDMSWWGGEINEFYIDQRAMKCDSTETHIILLVEKSVDRVTIKSKGQVLYHQAFTDNDANCRAPTKIVKTQVFNYEGWLDLGLPDTSSPRYNTLPVQTTETAKPPTETAKPTTEPATTTLSKTTTLPPQTTHTSPSHTTEEPTQLKNGRKFRQQEKPGESGEPGEVGEPGAPGDQGTKGNRGDQGDGMYCDEYCFEGEAGERGEPGSDGAQGEEGDMGPPGLKGDHGFPGNDGENGPEGAMGDPGDPGMPGTDGTPGLPGSCEAGTNSCYLKLGHCYAKSSFKLTAQCRLGYAATSIWRNSKFWGLRCCKIIGVVEGEVVKTDWM